MVLDRRGFLKFAAGAGAGLVATPVIWKTLDDVSIWTQNWPWIPRNQPGESTFAHAVSKMDPSGTPMRIRLVGGRPVRVLPVDDHPLGGGVTSLAVAEVQMLYSPGRVRRPLLKAPDGGFRELDWPAAVELLQEKCAAAGKNAAFISGDGTSTTNEVLSAFAKSLGSDKVFLMPSEGQGAARAAELMGLDAQIGYDLEKSDYVLAIGANMLEAWGTVVRNRRIFKDAHPHPVRNAANNGKEAASSAPLVYAGSMQNNTAAVAGAWLPIYPGTEGILAMGIAHMLIAKGRSVSSGDFSAFAALAAKYTPEETARLTGVDLKKLNDVVSALLAAKAPLVIAGSEFNQGAGAAPVMVGFAVNALLGNINRPGGLTLIPPVEAAVPKAEARGELYQKDLPSWLNDAKVALLVLHEANPVYALPNPEGVATALKAIPFKVSFSTFLDETAAMCDLILPLGMGLERVDDVETPYGSGSGIYCVTTPVVEAQQTTYSTGNVLLHIARQMKNDLGFELFVDVLKAKALQHEKCSFEVLASGQAAVGDTFVTPSGFKLRADILEKALQFRTAGGKLHLAPYVKLNLGTAKTGIPPYNNKTIRATELDGSTMIVMMNAATAAKSGLANGDRVMLDSGKRKIGAKLRVFEGVMNDTVAACLGFGRTALDEFSQNKGANVMELMTATAEPGTGLSVWNQTGVAVSKA
ncbi:MAG: molybdopterin-dependent oxidoreductase [Desulfovibrionaceae bacterium]|nr:molybdopterin-dependent oxidoreductase [Desulfovibrionaceae bacterium]